MTCVQHTSSLCQLLHSQASSARKAKRLKKMEQTRNKCYIQNWEPWLNQRSFASWTASWSFLPVSCQRGRPQKWHCWEVSNRFEVLSSQSPYKGATAFWQQPREKNPLAVPTFLTLSKRRGRFTVLWLRNARQLSAGRETASLLMEKQNTNLALQAAAGG